MSVPTVAAKRTFWEKATILHKESHRIANKTPDRYSRHYYDLYQLSQSDVKKAALQDLALLERVVKFKAKFYADNSARYGEATSQEIELLPNDKQLSDLKFDYLKMQAMMFGESPGFEDILTGLSELQGEIHALSSEIEK